MANRLIPSLNRVLGGFLQSSRTTAGIHLPDQSTKLNLGKVMAVGSGVRSVHTRPLWKGSFVDAFLMKLKRKKDLLNNKKIWSRRSTILPEFVGCSVRIYNGKTHFRCKITEDKVGKMTLGGLLALGYSVVVSYKRASTAVSIGNLSLSFETIDSLGETFLVLRGTNRKTVGAEALRMGINGPWLTKSYLEMILERKGVPCLNTPPPISSSSVSPPSNQERVIAAPKPI
ncbi:hypothetical protein SLA2020_116570 [Shorea laevis]